MSAELALLQRRLERERAARREAETILEQKALELYHANNELLRLNVGLEKVVEERTGALSTEQTRLRSLITNLDSGVLLEDENRKIVLVNQLFCQLFDIPAPPEALEGMDCSQSAEQTKHLFLDPPGFVARIDELLSKQEICSGESLHLVDGRVFSRTFIPVFSGTKYLGHLWKYQDVTAGHRATESLRHSEEKYRGIIENMELGLLEVDTNDVIVRAYPRFCAMVGYTEPELVGKSAIDIFLVPEFLPVLKKQSQERAKGIAGVYEVQIYKKGRVPIWVLISGAPILDTEDRVVGSLGIHYDITKQKDLQRDLEDARRSAEAAQEAEKQFLANMSHEIRTPLNAIIGMSHLLYDTQPSPEQREYLDILKNSAEMLRALISDVLDLSKIRAGHLEVQEKEFDLLGVVRSLVKSAQLRLEDSPVGITAHFDPTIKNLVIGDDLLLHQIMSNLLGNAEKFTERGKIVVSVQRMSEAAPIGNRTDGSAQTDRTLYEIAVSDTGIGIPPEKHALIFQSFRQVDGDIKRKFGGTGLGLAITRQIVEMQGGTIEVDSELGKGSTFRVRLPYRDTSKPIAEDDTTEPQQRLLHAKGKCVLVVEDNYMNRKYIGALLQKWGIAHTFAHNGKEGVELARQRPFDLVLMDIQMPEMDGYEACIAIRQTANPNIHTPIVALTASALLSQKDKAFAAGMDDYLSKPFKPVQLFEKIERFCGSPADNTGLEAATPSGTFQFHPRLHSPTLAELYGEDLEYAQEMFEVFLKNTRLEFDRLRPLLEKNQWADLARLAHKIKPTFAMIGLPDLEEQMQALETAAKTDPPDTQLLNSVLQTLELALPDAIAAIATDVEKLQNQHLKLKI